MTQKVEPLWPKGAPGSKGNAEEDTPVLFVRLPEPVNATGAAIVVCPGGGYMNLAMGHEGADVAEWLNGAGIAAFILRYRLPPKYPHPAPLQDAQRAIRTVRARAAEWGVHPERIGVLGFSAGGHLGATVSTHFGDGDPSATDPVERVSSRPDVAVLLYPLITLKPPHGHTACANRLLGTETPDPALVESVSNETQVTAHTPPTFLMHTTDDAVVPVRNSILYYTALQEMGVPAELHIFEQGVHGLGLAPDDPVVGAWPNQCLDWLHVRGII